MSYDQYQPAKRSLKKKLIIIAIVLAIGLALFGIWKWSPWHKESTTQSEQSASVSEQNTETTKPAEKQTPDFNAKKLKSALNTWAGAQSGTLGVTIADENGKVLAEKNGHHQFFAASIYKLYTAYVGYQKIDDGTYSLSEPYLGGWTREKCMYEMIHQSHSPCAEKLWNELGKSNLTNKMKAIGLTDTDMTGLVTSSHDAALMLSRIQLGTDLSSSSRKKYLDSMHTQIYRAALPAGFSGQEVYDKVGFRENVEYHDTAIVKFKDGRVLIVSVLTQNVGTTAIANLAKAIVSAVN